MVSWVNDDFYDRREEEDEDTVDDQHAELDNLLLHQTTRKGWYRKELIENEEKKMLRVDKQTSMLGSVILLMAT